jgi:hypothetical protein
MTKIILSLAILGVTILMIGAISMKAQTSTSNVTSIMGLNAHNINHTIDTQRLLLDRAMLHKANNTDILMNTDDLLHCIQSLLYHEDKITLGNCDGLIINHITLVNGTDITEKGYGNNQTMIKLAHEYLKARGIQ